MSFGREPNVRALNSIKRCIAHSSRLASGEHVMLTGAPGTAKTTLAELVLREATDAGWCDGYTLTTATSDWTTYETLGGLRPTKSGELEFAAGHFLAAIEQDRWLVIDELNRSNFDRAFGQLFTVLSGQAVVLPFDDVHNKRPIALAPEANDSIDPSTHHVVRIPHTWRIIATMNVFDKSLLFEMSFALMRRFTFIEVRSPDNDTYLRLIGSQVGDDRQDQIVSALSHYSMRAIRNLDSPSSSTWPRYVDARLAIEAVPTTRCVTNLSYSYLLPQFEGLERPKGGGFTE